MLQAWFSLQQVRWLESEVEYQINKLLQISFLPITCDDNTTIIFFYPKKYVKIVQMMIMMFIEPHFYFWVIPVGGGRTISRLYMYDDVLCTWVCMPVLCTSFTPSKIALQNTKTKRNSFFLFKFSGGTAPKSTTTISCTNNMLMAQNTFDYWIDEHIHEEKDYQPRTP